MRGLYRVLLILAAITFIYCGTAGALDLGNSLQLNAYESPTSLVSAYTPEAYSSTPDDGVALFKMGIAGNSDIQFKIGLMFGQGNSVEQNFSRCLHLLEKAANNGHIGAAFLLGTIYLKGGTLLDGVEGEAEYGGLVVPDSFSFDLVKAFSFYLVSGNGGDSFSQDLCYSIKKQILSSHADTAKAVDMLHSLKKYSMDGNTLAQRILAELYNDGEIVKQDYFQAFALYKESAERGDALSQYNIASKYISGLGVKQDFTEGFKWMKKAAEQNLAEAQFNLSTLYYQSKGDAIIQDKQMGYVWLLIAKENGHKEAKQLLDELDNRGLTSEEENTAHEIANKILVQITAKDKPLEQMDAFS